MNLKLTAIILVVSLQMNFQCRSQAAEETCSQDDVKKVKNVSDQFAKAMLNDELWKADNREHCLTKYSSMISISTEQAKEIGLPATLRVAGKKEDKVKMILDIMNDRRFHNPDYNNLDSSNMELILKKKFRLSAYEILKEGRMWGCTETAYAFMALAKYYGLTDIKLIHGLSPSEYKQCVCKNGIRIYQSPCGRNVPSNIQTHNDPNYAISSHWMVAVKDLRTTGHWAIVDVAAQGSSYKSKVFPIKQSTETLLRKVLKPELKDNSLNYFSKDGLLIDYVGQSENDSLCIFSGEQSMNVAATGNINMRSNENGKCLDLEIPEK